MINGGNKLSKTHSIKKPNFMQQAKWGVSPAIALELGRLLGVFKKIKWVDYFNRDIIMI
jgi:hypothetical protein